MFAENEAVNYALRGGSISHRPIVNNINMWENFNILSILEIKCEDINLIDLQYLFISYL